jgi:peptidoglycan/xylan/chitin deacetylase (PgdA/CDA1 family)
LASGRDVLKRVAATLAGSPPFAWFVSLLERLDHEPPDLLRVLTYHRVERSDAASSPVPGVTVAPEAFAEQMRIVRERYRAVSVEELIQVVRGRGKLAPRSVLITFDDGYRDFQIHAWPVLKSLEMPVVVFVPTAFPGEPERRFWWDRLYHALMHTTRRDRLETPLGLLALGTARQRQEVFRRLRAHAKQRPHDEAEAWVAAACRSLAAPEPPPAVLSWDQLRELAREGVTLGSHTRTHPLLTRIPPAEVRTELSECLADLKRELGSALPILAYPSGAFDDEVVRIVAEEGYLLAFTTVRGVNRLGRADPLKLKRINVGSGTRLAALRAQLLGRGIRWEA